MIADRTGFRTKYLPLSGQTENLSGLAAPELNSPAATGERMPYIGTDYREDLLLATGGGMTTVGI